MPAPPPPPPRARRDGLRLGRRLQQGLRANRLFRVRPWLERTLLLRKSPTGPEAPGAVPDRRQRRGRRATDRRTTTGRNAPRSGGGGGWGTAVVAVAAVSEQIAARSKRAAPRRFRPRPGTGRPSGRDRARWTCGAGSPGSGGRHSGWGSGPCRSVSRRLVGALPMPAHDRRRSQPRLRSRSRKGSLTMRRRNPASATLTVHSMSSRLPTCS